MILFFKMLADLLNRTCRQNLKQQQHQQSYLSWRPCWLCNGYKTLFPALVGGYTKSFLICSMAAENSLFESVDIHQTMSTAIRSCVLHWSYNPAFRISVNCNSVWIRSFSLLLQSSLTELSFRICKCDLAWNLIFFFTRKPHKNGFDLRIRFKA